MNKINKRIPIDICKKIYKNVYNDIINSDHFIKKYLELKTKRISIKQRIQLYNYLGYNIN